MNLPRDLVSPDYLLEASVVFVWLSALMPWSIVHSPLDEVPVSALFIRYPFVEIRYVLGSNLPTMFHTPVSGYQYHAAKGEPITTGYILWGVGAVLFAVALLGSIALFVNEDAIANAAPIALPRLFGGLLVGSGVTFVTAAVVFVVRGFAGTPVPLGALFMLGLGGILLINDLDTPSSAEPTPADD